MHRVTGNHNKGMFQILLGTGVGLVFILAGISIMTWLLLSQKIGKQRVDILISGVLLVASFLGARISSWLLADFSLPASAITTAAIICLMVIAGLIAEGPFQNVFQIILSQGMWFRWLVYLGLLFMILVYGAYGLEYTQTEFIYFQF